MAEDVSDEHQDQLPEELDVTAYVGPYVFPNINRRRIPAVMYAALAVLCFAGWVWSTNAGLLCPSCAARLLYGKDVSNARPEIPRKQAWRIPCQNAPA